MSSTRSIYTVCAIVLGLLALIVNSTLSTNPDYIPPFITDFVIVALLLLCGFFCYLSQKKIQKVTFFKEDRLLISAALIVFISILLRSSVTILNPYTTASSCAETGGLFYQIQCYVFSGATGTSTVRKIPPHFFSIVVALVAGFAVKAYKSPVVVLILFSGFTFGIFLTEEYLAVYPASKAFHAQIFGTNESLFYGFMSGPFTNIGWVWPYLGPATAVSLWLAFGSHDRKTKWTGFFLTLVCAWILLKNGQRGAVANLVLLFLAAILWKSFIFSSKKFRGQKLKKKDSVAIIGLGLLLGFLALIIAMPGTQTINEYTAQYGFELRKLPFSIDNARLNLLKYGVMRWLEAPFFGHGHGSWIHLSKLIPISEINPMMYESAHNLYIQMLAELGLLHTTFNLLVFTCFGVAIFKNLKTLPSGPLLFIFLFICFLTATSVQEIDYIRSTYYVWAILLGILAFNRSEGTNPLIFKKWFFLWPIPIILVLIFSAKALFNSGAYAFEPNPSSINWPRQERWLKSTYSLNYFSKDNSDSANTFAVKIAGLGEENHSISGSAKNAELGFFGGLKDNDYIFSKNSNRTLGMHADFWTLEPTQRIDSRIVAARVGYPPFYSDFPLIWGRNIAVYSDGGKMTLNCEKSCYMIIGSCRDPNLRPFFQLNLNLPTTIQSLDIEDKKKIDIDVLLRDLETTSSRVVNDLSVINSNDIIVKLASNGSVHIRDLACK
jgi:hypothetical protein